MGGVTASDLNIEHITFLPPINLVLDKVIHTDQETNTNEFRNYL